MKVNDTPRWIGPAVQKTGPHFVHLGSRIRYRIEELGRFLAEQCAPGNPLASDVED
jgi:hypothetical protein